MEYKLHEGSKITEQSKLGYWQALAQEQVLAGTIWFPLHITVIATASHSGLSTQ